MTAVALATPTLVTGPAASSAAAQADPVHALAVTGPGDSLSPAFDPGVRRYTLRSGGNSVRVQATTSDPDGLVRVNGRPVAADGTATVGDLDEGDEVSVLVTDSAGTTAYSMVRVPESFPAVDVVTHEEGVSEGHVFLTFTNFFGGDRFEAVLDAHGAPVHVRRTTNSMDLKLQPNGSYSVARADNSALVTPYDIVELDERFEEVAAYRTVGLDNTDFHDSILRPDGSRYLMAYEENDETGKVDSIVQHVAASGELLFEWNSEDHIDPEIDGLTPLADYAHLNSLDVMADGDLLMSFRHTSQVLKVARTAHDGFQPGDVVWRLGGVRSDFAFPDDPYAGPCAQHTAREVEDGHILIFDNGSQVTATTLEPMCADPADPTGERVERPQSRMVEFELDEAAGEARVTWSWERPGLFAEFAGSAQRLPGGNTLAGFAAASPDLVEVDSAGDVVWELDVPDAFSYRALKFPAPDAIEPEVAVTAPGDGGEVLEGDQIVADYTCTDRGGSGLTGCEGPVLPGEELDTSVPGDHELVVTATDAAGNTTTVTRSYRVLARWRPDAMLRAKKGQAWQGRGVHSDLRAQTLELELRRAGAARTVWFKVRNDADRAGRIRLRGTGGSKAFRVVWRDGGKKITGKVTAGRYRTPRLAPGESARLKVVVTRQAAADPGRRRSVRLTASAGPDDLRTDAVRARFTAR